MTGLEVWFTLAATHSSTLGHTICIHGLEPLSKTGLRLKLHLKHAITSLPFSFMLLRPVEALLIYEDRRTWRSWQALFATMRTGLKSEANLITGRNILCHVRLCKVPRRRSLPPATRKHAVKPNETFYRLDSWDVRTSDFYIYEKQERFIWKCDKIQSTNSCRRKMHSKHDRLCTYNVIVRRVRATLLYCKDNKYYIL
jgi:hypothetical protein